MLNPLPHDPSGGLPAAAVSGTALARDVRRLIEDRLLDHWRKTASGAPQATAEELLSQVIPKVDQLFCPLFEQLAGVTEQDSAAPVREAAAVMAAVIGDVAGTVLARAPHGASSILAAVDWRKLTGTLMTWMSTPQQTAAWAQAGVLRREMAAGHLGDTLYCETDLRSISTLTSHAACLAAKGEFASYLLLRDDLFQALESGQSDNVPGFRVKSVHYMSRKPLLVPSGDLLAALLSFQCQPLLLIDKPRQYEPADLRETEDLSRVLAGKRLCVFPVAQGDVYLGALALVGLETTPVLSEPAHNQLTQIAADCGRAIGHVHRMHKTSPDFGELE